MRELQAELGIQFRIVPGPRRRLTEKEGRALATIVMSRPDGSREALIDDLAVHLGVGKTTLKRAMAPYRIKPIVIRRASSTDRAIPARAPSERIVSI